LKSPDFFDAEKFPEITFKSTSIAKDGDDFKLAGNLTIHGVTKPVELKVESHGQGKDPWGNERAGFSVKASVSRKEFGLQWNQALETGGVVVGDKVEIEADIESPICGCSTKIGSRRARAFPLIRTATWRY
jgi:polyisoprenoid-binding protein YceI